MAGPWLPSVQARGGSIYKYASARPQDPKQDYEMVVLDGRWIVSPRGEQLEGAEPNQVEIQLAPGDERRIDFVVRGSAMDGEEATRVSVRKPEGRRVLDTPVEVWDADPENRPATPLPRSGPRTSGSPTSAGSTPTHRTCSSPAPRASSRKP